MRQWSGHSLGPPLRLGLRRPLGPGLRLEPLQSSQVAFAGADARARPFARARASHTGYAQPPPCPVGSCGRATRSFRSLRAACGAACGLPLRAQQERAKPRSSRSQFARSPRFSPSPSIRRGSRSRAGYSLSHMHCHVLGLARLAVVARPACTPRVEADVAEEPEGDTQVRVAVGRVGGDREAEERDDEDGGRRSAGGRVRRRRR